MEEIFVSKSPEETQSIAESFTQQIQNGGVILLHGNLGSGKTTFVQGLAKELGIKKRIISPTFVILRSYEVPNSKMFYHVDLYRLENEKEIADLGLVELMKNSENIIVIEWPERLGSLVPEKRWELMFNVVGETKREIRIQKI